MCQSKLTLLVLLSAICIQGSTGVFWPCESDDDCTADGSKCSTVTNLCECNDFESVFSEDFTKCLKTSLFGDTCEDTVQCNLMPSGANCKSGVCDCADGHQYVRGRCRQTNGLDQPCNTDIDCYFGYDRQSVSCQNNVCACANGYYRRHGNICRRKSMAIGDACVVDNDCDALGQNVQCKFLECQYVDEIQIKSPSSNEQRRSNTAADTPKTDTSSTDINSEYTAKAQSSQSSENTPILVNGNNDSTDHELDEQIKQDKQDKQKQQQQEQQEQQQNPHKLLEIKKSREIAIQTSIDAIELKDLTRSKKNVGTATASTSTSSRLIYNQKKRRTGFRFADEDIKSFSTLSNTDDEPDARKYGSSCVENGKPCIGLPHSVCANNVCFCRQGYYHENSKCFAELGEIAESSDECDYEYEESTKKCLCQKNFYYESNLRDCRKPIPYSLSCTSNSQCSPFGAAFCRKEIPRRCTCAEFAEYDAIRQMCFFKQGLGAECDRNEGCPVDHSICLNRYCVCKDKFIEKDGACLAGVGAECAKDDDCMVDDSICDAKTTTRETSDDEQKEKTCQCRKGFVHFKDQCLKEAEEIEDECIETEQCKPLLGTCIEKKCKCTDGQHFKNGRCETQKAIGEACARAGECFVAKDPENVECRNSVCQCKFGYKANAEQKICIRVMPNKKNSSGRPSALKIITFVLIGSAFLITSAAIKQAYY